MNYYYIAILLILAFAGETQAVAADTAPLSLEISLGKDQAYPGEIVPFTVTFRAKGVTVRNVGYPNFARAGDRVSLATPAQTSEGDEGQVSVYRFPGQLVAGGEGVETGPATLECEVMEPAAGSAAFFGEATPRKATVTAPSARLRLRPLPKAGRPESFSGAVGRFAMTVVGTPETVALGDPVTVVTTIRGSGTLGPARCPDLTGAGRQAFPARITRTETGIVCDQVIIPIDRTPLPSVEWSYFDPTLERYRTMTASLGHIRVAGDHKASVSATPPPIPPAMTPTDRPVKTWWFAAVSLFCLSLFTLIKIKGRRTPLSAALPVVESRLADQLVEVEQLLRAGDVEKFYTLTFRMLQQCIASKTGLPPMGILSLAGVTICNNPHDNERLCELIHRCHLVRYGRITPSADEMECDLLVMKTAVAHCSPSVSS